MKSYFQTRLIQHLLNTKEDRQGFTLIELLVVVIIIGILGAIALPAFLTITTKAKESEAKTFLSNYIKGQQLYFTENSNTFAPQFADLALGIKPNTANYDFAFTVNTDRTLTTTENNLYVNAQPRTPDLKSAAGVINLGVSVDIQSGVSRFTLYSETAGALKPPLDQGNSAPALGDVFILSTTTNPVIQSGYDSLK